VPNPHETLRIGPALFTSNEKIGRVKLALDRWKVNWRLDPLGRDEIYTLRYLISA